GVQLRGATYLGCSPVKMEYALYVANGTRLPLESNLTALADLGGFVESTKDVNDAIAWGSRVGFWVPAWGVNVGFSTFFNRPYGHDTGPDFNLWGIDASYHKGNWDARFEFADTFQRTPVPPPAEGVQAAGGGEGEPEPATPTSLHIRRR